MVEKSSQPCAYALTSVSVLPCESAANTAHATPHAPPSCTAMRKRSKERAQLLRPLGGGGKVCSVYGSFLSPRLH